MAAKNTHRIFPWIFFLAPVLGLASCGGPAPETAEVSGKVTLGAKPVVVGELTMVAEDGRFATAIITDGTYRMPNAPVGHVQVSVTGRTVQFAPDEGMKARADGIQRVNRNAKLTKEGKPTEKLPVDSRAVPSKLAMGTTSGITYDVKPGAQTWDLDLKP